MATTSKSPSPSSSSLRPERTTAWSSARMILVVAMAAMLLADARMGIAARRQRDLDVEVAAARDRRREVGQPLREIAPADLGRGEPQREVGGSSLAFAARQRVVQVAAAV